MNTFDQNLAGVMLNLNLNIIENKNSCLSFYFSKERILLYNAVSVAGPKVCADDGGYAVFAGYRRRHVNAKLGASRAAHVAARQKNNNKKRGCAKKTHTRSLRG